MNAEFYETFTWITIVIFDIVIIIVPAILAIKEYRENKRAKSIQTRVSQGNKGLSESFHAVKRHGKSATA